MANQNILTYGLKVIQLKQDYFSSAAYLKNSTNVLESIYCFLSRVDPWTDENNPPTPTQDQQYIKNVFKNMFVAKAITPNNITPVARRIDWVSGKVFDYYQDNVDMLAVDENGFLIKSFYIKNRYDQVFKCLWNNNGAQSTVEPFFQPGNYNTNNVFTGSDGYKWKYLYTIDVGSKIKFMDSTWIPVPLGQNTPNPKSSSLGIGSIDVVNVTNGGSGYDAANSPITISITGDGSGATANAVVSGGIASGQIFTYHLASGATTTRTQFVGTGATFDKVGSGVGLDQQIVADGWGITSSNVTEIFHSETDLTLSSNTLIASGSLYGMTSALIIITWMKDPSGNTSSEATNRASSRRAGVGLASSGVRPVSTSM